MKYEIIQTNHSTSFTVDCPIQLVKSMVTKNTETGVYFLNVKYFSMLEKPIENICLRLSVKEDKNPNKSNIAYIFSPSSGVAIMQNCEPFPFFMGAFKNVEISVSKISFADGSIWKGGAKQLVSDSPEKIDISKFEKYNEQISEKFAHIPNIKYAYSENEHVWRCPCGCVNQKDSCFICGNGKIDTRNFFDAERLERAEGWRKEKLRTDETKILPNQLQEKSAQLSAVLDSVIIDAKSENSQVVAGAIATINEIYNEELFLKKVQASEMLEKANARFKGRKDAEADFKHMMTREANILAERKRLKKQRTRKITKVSSILASIFVCLCLICISSFYVVTEIAVPAWQYESALTSFENGQYDDAINKFTALGEYENSAEMVTESTYKLAESYIQSGDYESARAIFQNLGEYENSASYVTETFKMEGVYHMAQKNYYAALEVFGTISDYDGIYDLQNQCYYNLAIEASDNGEDDLALELFYQANDYAYSADYILSIIKTQANTYYASGNYAKLIQLLENSDYDFVYDYMTVAVPAYETEARAYYDAGEYFIAKEMYAILENSTQWLTEVAANRVLAYPVFCDARLYANNYDEVIAVFDLSYESYAVIQEVSGYMVNFLSDSKWVAFSFSDETDTSVSARNMTVDKYGYTEMSLQSSITEKGTLTYEGGYLYVDGKKVVEIKVSSYTGISLSIGGSWYSYARSAYSG
ncbi:MAG: tetratricopeptide repeat protein [Bacillota bacterium]